MSRILIVSHPELGHLLPILPIAEQLRAAGHDVEFMATSETRWLFKRRHFRVKLWIDDEETLPIDDVSALKHIPCGRTFWREYARRAGVKKVDAIRTRLLEVAAQWRPEHFIVDSLLALNFGLDCADAPFFGRVTLIGTSLPRWDDLPDRIEFPYLFLCPQQFEVPDYVLKHPLVRYVEPSSCQPYPLQMEGTEAIDSEKTIILVSFGTQASFQSSFMQRLVAINEVASRHRDLTFTVGLNGMHIEACRLSGFCHQDNVELHQQLPQQQLLKRAAAFVTHGGLSSIKEGILAGIPMIVTPEVFDQPFNAMRAVYHRLAPAIFTDEMNARALELALNSILEHTLRSPEISYFQSIFAEASANPQAALIIENQMSGCHRL